MLFTTDVMKQLGRTWGNEKRPKVPKVQLEKDPRLKPPSTGSNNNTADKTNNTQLLLGSVSRVIVGGLQ